MHGLSRIRTGIIVLATAACVVAPGGVRAQTPGAAVEAARWKFGASVYAYLPTIGGAMAFPVGGTGPGIDIDAAKILENLNFTFMGSLDVHNGRWGLFTDLIYMDVGGSKSESRDFSIGRAAIPATASADLSFDLKGTIWTAAGQYRVASEPALTIDVLGGFRLFDLHPQLSWSLNGDIGTLPLPGRSGGSEIRERVWDGIVGVKGAFRFGAERAWKIPFYADVGTGQSNLTWQAGAGIGYGYGWGDLVAMWRYIGYDFKSGKSVSDMNFNGPMVGAVFRW